MSSEGSVSQWLAQLKDVALLTVSGKTGKGIDTVIEVAFDLRDAWARRVPTRAMGPSRNTRTA